MQAATSSCTAVLAPSIFWAQQAMHDAAASHSLGPIVFLFLGPTEQVKAKIASNKLDGTMTAGVTPDTYAAKAVFVMQLVASIADAPPDSPLLAEIIRVVRDTTHEATCGLYHSVAASIFREHEVLQVLTLVFDDASLSVVYTRADTA